MIEAHWLVQWKANMEVVDALSRGEKSRGVFFIARRLPQPVEEG